MFVLNTSRPLFKNNPKLRQALNFAVDRKTLTRELGPFVGTATDQYLRLSLPGFRDERIYPLKGPDLKKARALAKGHMRERKAVSTRPTCRRRGPGGRSSRRTSRRSGSRSTHVSSRARSTSRSWPHPESRSTSADRLDRTAATPSLLNYLFDGRTIGEPGSATTRTSTRRNTTGCSTRRRASPEPRATGPTANSTSCSRATPRPAIPFADLNALGVRLRPRRLRRHEPVLDLTAVCLK